VRESDNSEDDEVASVSIALYYLSPFDGEISFAVYVSGNN
jgi:hypothetical protein